MNIQILNLIEKNAKITAEEIATITELTVEQVTREIAEMTEAGVICAYKGVIDWDKVVNDRVSAIIELKVCPTAGYGFEEVARRIARYPEVESVYLMSGGYDLSVIVRAKTFQEVAMFVSKELATIDSVTSTATHFVMRRYKEFDINFMDKESDERGNILL